MPQQIIEVGGVEYEFPDGMSDDDIKAALSKELGGASPPSTHPLGAVGEEYETFPGAVGAFGKRALAGLSSRLGPLLAASGQSTSERMANTQARGVTNPLTLLGGAVSGLVENVSQPSRYLEDPIRAVEDVGLVSGAGQLGRAGLSAARQKLAPTLENVSTGLIKDELRTALPPERLRQARAIESIKSEKLRSADSAEALLKRLGTEQERLVGDATARGVTVPKKSLGKGAASTVKRLQGETSGNPLGPQQAVSTLRTIRKGNPVAETLGPDMPADAVLRLRRVLDNELASPSAGPTPVPFREGTRTSRLAPAQQIQKAVRTDATRELRKAIPELTPIEARYSPAITAKEALSKSELKRPTFFNMDLLRDLAVGVAPGSGQLRPFAIANAVRRVAGQTGVESGVALADLARRPQSMAPLARTGRSAAQMSPAMLDELIRLLTESGEEPAPGQ